MHPRSSLPKVPFLRALLVLALSLGLASPAFAEQASDLVSPERSTVSVPVDAVQARQPVHAAHWMVAVANPIAAEAGAEVLRKGGNAADATVAIQTVLGLVEPQSSGLGGGGFLLYWDAARRRLTTFDARETAPAAATPQLFLDEHGAPLQFYDAVVGGRSVGAPGTPRLLELLHNRYGRLAWPDLFGKAIDLAEKGFVVSPRLAGEIKGDEQRLARFDGTRNYFLKKDGTGIDAGTTLTNPAYAATLKKIRDGGAEAFYKGAIADDIARTVQHAPGNPGVLSVQDLATYQVKEREPVCEPYRGYRVCGMGPPSSGGIAIGQILGLLSHFDLAKLGPDDPQSWQLMGDATRLAYADRERFVADSDFLPVPTQGLLDPVYLAKRAALLKAGTRLDKAEAGSPEWDHAMNTGDGNALELPSTSHFVVVDQWGNIVSMTTTIENEFGSRLMVDGFLLNNELTDFSFKTRDGDRPVANRVEPGKRPRSTMAPTVVLKDGKPVLALGSPGGAMIVPFVAEALVANLDWGMDLQKAVSLPHAMNRSGAFELEAGTQAAKLGDALKRLGYDVKVEDMNSGLHAIAIGPDGLTGAADPRREGVAIGE
ncbi:gamma-glutamyltransferase 1 Threonine peptidase. MEROPS family T03 [Faunimonas pinastri]|uniref:Glutathione hydrolase proenzyme n=1 Tax=Faunimonas pinastri TaxID=1855383 RepID=A0A1H9HKT4_9HYPH|nr:gamma-glutamyltransferase [Faunimonas pinastri]SEQ62832.1 gamma-glutamyltransferase 1 Threonine peptidase. MEROPS family T03 [Faunimonas pinastri]